VSNVKELADTKDANDGPARLGEGSGWRIIVFVATALLLTVPAVRADSTGTNAPAEPTFWFPVGEELVYTVYWGIIPVGESRIITRWVEHEEETLLSIYYRTRSNKVIATVYPVDDVIESLIDPAMFRPLRFTKNLKEGRHRFNEETTFDYEKKLANWRSHITMAGRFYPIEDDTRDLLCFMYHLRKAGFSEGQTLSHKVMADEKVYDLTIEVGDKKKRIKIGDYGKIPCLKLTPKAEFDGLFVRNRDITMWVSDDPRHLVAKIIADLPFANIRAVLSEVNGPGDDTWVQK